MALTEFQDQAAISLLGILTSGLISTVVAHRFSTRRAFQDLQRQKIELAVVGIARYEKFIQSIAVTYILSLNGKFAQEAFDKTVKANEGKEHSEQCSMLLNVYFPDLVPLYDKFTKTADSITNSGFPLIAGTKKVTPEAVTLLSNSRRNLTTIKTQY